MKSLLVLLVLFIFAYSQPILAEADRMVYEKNSIIYIGNVKMTKGNELLTADKVIIYLDENKKANSAEAEGKVFYTDGKRIAKADKAFYDFKKDIVQLISNAKVEEGSNFVEADEIIYYRKEERAIAISKNKKVRSFYVEEKEKK
ncbi:MAG: lipopolysaccharide transport periplasmic protein LptA [Thermocrinis sp.]|nr:lipopolysaccharide transport periplasmic protein LptA [Thermocrinis sp.]